MGITDPIHLDRLSEIIESGTCVLFLGAGVSIDSGAPSGRQLSNELWQEFLPSLSELNDLGHICELIDANSGRRALNDWLLDRFHGLVPKGALLSFPKFRWKSIYTMNFDTLLEEVYTKDNASAQVLRPFYSDKDPISRLRPNEVPLYKLHGCLSRAYSDDGHLVLTPDDFARVYESRQRFFNRLLDDATDFTIFSVGFGRQDPDFRNILLEVERSAARLRDLRRSYALQPGFNPAEANFWEGKRVTLIDATASDFFGRLMEKRALHDKSGRSDNTQLRVQTPLSSRGTKLTDDILADVARNFEILDEQIRLQEPNTAEFFLGAQPNWGTITVEADAPRDLRDDVLASVLEDFHLDSGDVRFTLIHAEAGSGKSTLLRRIGVDLALTWERQVVALKPFGSLDFLSLERIASASEERIFVLIDDAVTVAHELSRLIASARRAKTKLTILASARTNEWREVQEDFGVSADDEFEISQLSRDEIEGILKTLEDHDSLGMLSGVSHETQVAAFETRAAKQLLVAMREATEGRNFVDIIVNEYDRIPSPDGQRAYLLVASLHRFGIWTRAGLLHRALDIPLKDLGWSVLKPTTKVIVAQEPLGETDYYYTTRHPLIAEIVFDRKVSSDRRRLAYYENLVKHLDLGYSSDYDAYKKLTRGKNKQLLRDFSEPNNRREIMRQLVQLDPTDAFALQHAAMMELDERNVDAAWKYLSQAIEVQPDNASIRDTEGRLVLLGAQEEPNLFLADAQYARAEDIFERNIQRRPDEPFSYRHLAETYVRWSERKANPHDRLATISLAYDVLLKGIERCPSSTMLLQYQAELEQSVFDNPDSARALFARILFEKPGDVVTRFMAAKLEENQGELEQALILLKGGLETQPFDPKLHFRISQLMARLHPEAKNEICGHFEAALLASARDFQPRLAYGAYLFSQREFAKAKEQFAALDQLVVPNRVRFEPRYVDFGTLSKRHSGVIRSLSYDHGIIEFSNGEAEIHFNTPQLPFHVRKCLNVGTRIGFDIRFNLKGPVAINVSLAAVSDQLPLDFREPRLDI